ncbi:MAG: hypothetical protein AB1696_25175 [Planctomycetota bacterium]
MTAGPQINTEKHGKDKENICVNPCSSVAFVDLIMATFGAREAVERCLTSLFAVDAGHPFRLTIYDNVESEKDGTRDFLKAFEAPGDFNVIYAADNMGHGHCLDYLVKHTAEPRMNTDEHGKDKEIICVNPCLSVASSILVALDSDLVFTPAAAGWLRAIVEAMQEPVAICGNIAPAMPAGSFRGVWLTRVRPMILAVERAFLMRWGLSFAPCRWKATHIPCRSPRRGKGEDYHNEAWGVMPSWFLRNLPEVSDLREVSSGRADQPFDIRGDVGWQFYHVLGHCGVERIAPLPPIVDQHVQHVGHSSILPLVERRRNLMREVTIIRKGDPTPIRGEVGSLKIFERKADGIMVMRARIGDDMTVHPQLFIPWANVDYIAPGAAVSGPQRKARVGSECGQVNALDHGADTPVAEVPAK